MQIRRPMNQNVVQPVGIHVVRDGGRVGQDDQPQVRQGRGPDEPPDPAQPAHGFHHRTGGGCGGTQLDSAE